MLTSTNQSILIFIILCTLLILLLVFFVATIFFRYQQKQNAYFKDIEALQSIHKNALLQSQLEIQEQTFQNISREIHDSIGQKLTLAKLHLNTLDYSELSKTRNMVGESIDMIGEAINDLTDLSRSMSSEIILSNGLIKALEYEVEQLMKPGLYKIDFKISGNSVFLESEKELVLFRILQEAINNIIKHAEASTIDLHLYYGTEMLTMEIADNGKGFSIDTTRQGTGLHNIKRRAALLNGKLNVNSTASKGTRLKIDIPLYDNNKGF